MSDVQAQLARWDSLRGYIAGNATLEHTASQPARFAQHGNGYVVTAIREDEDAKGGRSRRVVIGPIDTDMDTFLDEVAALVEPRQGKHPALG